MSTLRTNAILDASGGTTATVNGYAPTLSNMAGRNRIINGDMRIDQRNAGAVVTAEGYLVDRWRCWRDQTYDIQQSTDAPTGFSNSLRATKTNTTQSLYGYFVQYIEGVNFSDLMFGTANSQSVTVSFWVKSSVTGIFSAGLTNSAENRTYSATYTINAANTWEQKTITIAGDTSGTWVGSTNGKGCGVWFNFGASGSAGTNTSNAWVSGSVNVAAGGTANLGTTNGATFYITGVQLEAGSIATPFERRLYGDELALCQRYAINYRSAEANGAYYRYAYGECVSSTQLSANIVFPVTMRAIPSLTTTGTAANYAVYSRTAVVGLSTVPTLGTDGMGKYWANIGASTAGSLTQGSAGALMSNNNQTSYLLFTAEL